LVYLLLLYLFIFQAKKYQIDNKFLVLYGISQNPDTNDYILVQNNFIWASGNEKIDDFIRKIKLEFNNGIFFEWIPYFQFDEVKEIGKGGFSTVYSAIWKDGPLLNNEYNNHHKRNSNKEVTLKCLHNSKDPAEFVINEVKYF
jgi:D-alanyl-lipoteichoic acid acyltransferase DltB (MBOAT superfamily)